LPINRDALKKIRINKYLKLFLKIAITVLALYFVFNKISIGQITQLISRSYWPYILVGLLFFILSKLIAAFRLNYFFRSTGLRIAEKRNIRLYLLGMFYNLFLPGGIGGDGYKIYLLNKQEGVKVGKLFWAILLDRVIGILALFCLLVGFSYFIPYPAVYKYFTWLLAPLAVLVFYLVVRRFFNDFSPIIFRTLFFSFFVQGFQLVTAIFILLSLGIEQQFTQYLFVFMVSSIVAALPFTVGGLGARELTFLYGAELMNLNMDASVTLSLLFYLITAAVSLSGMYYSFDRRGLGTGLLGY